MVIVPSIAEFLAYRDYSSEILRLSEVFAGNDLTESEVADALGVSDLRTKAVLRVLSALDLVSLITVQGFEPKVMALRSLGAAAASLTAKEVLWTLEVSQAKGFGGAELGRKTHLTIAKSAELLKGITAYRLVTGTLSTAEADLHGVVVTQDQALLLQTQDQFI